MTSKNAQAMLAIVAGVVILVQPNILQFAIATYLIVFGVLRLTGK